MFYSVQKRTWVLLGVIIAIIILGNLTGKFDSVNRENQPAQSVASQGGGWTSSENRESPTIVRTFKVTDLSFDNNFALLTGVVESNNDVSLRTQSRGVITDVKKSLGEHVAANTIIAAIENSTEFARVLQANSGLELAKTSLNAAISSLNIEAKFVGGASLRSAQESLAESIAALRNAVANHKRARGNFNTNIVESMTNAAVSRLRPVVLTTLTTIAGMVPLIIVSELWGPLAIAVIFGLSYSLVLTLILTSILYTRWGEGHPKYPPGFIMSSFHNVRRRLLRRA